MKNSYQRKAASKNNHGSTIQDIYKQFIEKIVAQGFVSALFDVGWALCTTPQGQRALAVWQHKSLARLLIKDNWANYKIQDIPLKAFVEKVIPFLRQEKTCISIDLTPEGKNVLVAPEKLLVDIKKYLYQIYMQKPELFADSGLPLPRNIRLN